MRTTDRSKKRVVLLGGGLSSIATALALSETGAYDVTILEKGSRLGGLAGSFEREGRSYPLGYHHILHRDGTLLAFFDMLGLSGKIIWKRIRMLFEDGGRLLDLGSVQGLWCLRMSLAEKWRFGLLMLRVFLKKDWSEWDGRSAEEFLDHYGAQGARREVFEKLTRLRFQKSCAEISASWLASRLHYREGSARLGYIAERNWTSLLCEGLENKLRERGVTIRTNVSVASLEACGARIDAVLSASGESFPADVVVSSLPLPVLDQVLGDACRNPFADIRYSSLVSMIFSTREASVRDFYWLNLSSLRHDSSALFNLTSLNPGLGESDESIFNFVLHAAREDGPCLKTDPEIIESCMDDFERLFGQRPKADWIVVNRVSHYCPIFDPNFRRLPLQSETYANLFLTGNYRSFPSIMSTGTALESGLVTARSMLAADGLTSSLCKILPPAGTESAAKPHSRALERLRRLWDLLRRPSAGSVAEAVG